MDRRMFLYFLGILLLLSALCACQAAGTAPLPTPTTEPTNTALPIATDTRSPTITPTNTPTPDAVATKQAEQAEFEAKKAEALKMVSIKLNSSEDLANLPVNDARDFDNHNIQDEIHWLINNDKNDLPPADDVKLPDTWRIARNNDTGFYWMSYDMLAEARVKTYRSVAAFFVMQDGKMMLRIGVEYGGKDKLVFINLEDPIWWTDQTHIQKIIAAYNRDGLQFLPIVQFGNDSGFAPEKYTAKVNAERLKDGDKFFNDWAKGQLPADADKTVMGMVMVGLVK